MIPEKPQVLYNILFSLPIAYTEPDNFFMKIIIVEEEHSIDWIAVPIFHIWKPVPINHNVMHIWKYFINTIYLIDIYAMLDVSAYSMLFYL